MLLFQKWNQFKFYNRNINLIFRLQETWCDVSVEQRSKHTLFDCLELSRRSFAFQVKTWRLSLSFNYSNFAKFLNFDHTQLSFGQLNQFGRQYKIIQNKSFQIPICIMLSWSSISDWILTNIILKNTWNAELEYLKKF